MTTRFLPVLLLFALAVPGRADPAAPALPAARFTADRLVSALTRDLSEHFSLEGDLKLDLLRPWPAPERAASSWSVVVTDYPALPASTLVVRYQLVGDGQVAAEDTVVLRAAVWRDCWFARQPVTANSPFDPADLEARRIDTLRDRDALPAAAGDRSYVFARDIGAGRMITWRDVARRPLVRKGEVVEAVASEGSLVVTLKALALQSGGQGDLITVRNLETLKNISAQVIADSRVQVQF